MKRLAFLTLMILALLTGAVFASPQNDFAQGKTYIDIGFMQQKLETANSFFGYTPYKWDKKWNLDFGATFGLGDKFAVQYKYQDIDGTMTLYGDKTNSDIQEFNLIYKIDDHFRAFVGAQRLTGKISTTAFDLGTLNIRSTTRFQAGITGITKLNDKLNAWATASAGKDIKMFEVGMGYPINKDVDINVFYRYLKIEDFKLDHPALDSFDVKFKAERKGLGLGVTWKI